MVLKEIIYIASWMTLVMTNSQQASQEKRLPRSVDKQYFTIDSVLHDWAYISSPGHPNYYNSNLLYQWHLRASPGHIVNIQILKMDIEYSLQCIYDYLQLSNINARKEKYCGRLHRAQHFLSLTEEADIIFLTDNTQSGTGFSLRFRSIDNNIPECFSEMQWDHILIASMAEQTLQSQGYPVRYRSNFQENWLIVTPNRTKGLILTMLDADLEESNQCTYDYVAVYDSKCPIVQSQDRYCGKDTPSLTFATSKAVFIKFSTDFTRSGRGFKMSYRVAENDESKSDDNYGPFSTVAIVMLMVSIFVILIIICRCIYHRLKIKNLQQHRQQHSINPQIRDYTNNSFTNNTTMSHNAPGVFVINTQSSNGTRSNATAFPQNDGLIQPPSYQSLFASGIINHTYDIGERLTNHHENETGIIRAPADQLNSRNFMSHGIGLSPSMSNMSSVLNPERRDNIMSPPPSYEKIFGSNQ